MKRFLTYVLASLILVSGLRAEDLYRRYVNEVVFGAEFGSAAAYLVSWPGDVSVRIVGGSADVRADIADTLGFLDRFMTKTDFFYRSPTSAGSADLTIYAVPKEDFLLADKIPPRSEGYTILWSSGPDLKRVIVWLDPDSLLGPGRMRLIREELFQAMGFAGDFTGPGSITSDDETIVGLQDLDLLALITAYANGNERFLYPLDFIRRTDELKRVARAGR